MSTVTLDIPKFRALFPQFADPQAFPDPLITLQFEMACIYVSPEVCGCMTLAQRELAVYLMTAHLMALNVIIAGGNGQPGIVTSATVDKVSITLEAPPQRSQWAYWLNTTPYGQQLVALLDGLSVGGFFVGSLPERAAFRQVGGIFL